MNTAVTIVFIVTAVILCWIHLFWHFDFYIIHGLLPSKNKFIHSLYSSLDNWA